MLDKTYDPAAIEARILARWTEAAAFKAGRPERANAEPYSIAIPPPNVTGSLHMGHALNNTLQDVLCRFERMRGKDVLWQPGTDHAGIATQMVVERQLMERQEPGRHQLGRARFIERIWAWKAESGGTIGNQLRRLGASCDWSRERFTMDEGLSRAVLKVFVDLYNEGLIYKDNRLVNWDPDFQSALSNLEVDDIEHTGSFKWARGQKDKDANPVPFNSAALAKVLDRDPNGHMYYFRYSLSGIAYAPDDPSTFLTVGTTRPETMLGDTAVAVHPDDERYKHVVGKTVTLPLVGRKIPIVADDYADPEKGSGAVKITPAHDFNDYKVYKRHSEIGLINILDAKAQLNENVPEKYRGLDRFVARKQVVADLEAAGLLERIEPTSHAVPHAQRGGAIIEPWLTDQWYVNAAELARRAITVVESGETRFIPENWEKTYFEWMRNIEPWCISRQIWWGHQIPAWYGPDGKVFVALNEAGAAKQAMAHYKKNVALERDPDVLDTWFSSALWPFSTLGWPDQTPEVKRFYPTSVLVTGFDIIFFWVARMLMMGLHFMKEIPFHHVYIHALVRDEKGQKMSKTRGNVMDPLDIIDGIELDRLIQKRVDGLMDKKDAARITRETRKDYPNGIAAYGADALRFTLAAMAAQGRDIKLSIKAVEGNRNFATKLWNATRFAELNGCIGDATFDPKGVKETVNGWIAGEVERTAAAVTAGIKAYKFNEAAGAVYDFTWGTFCDWYLELTKPVLDGDDEAAKAETRAATAWALDQILKLLHPFMPFITEELWGRRDRARAAGDGLLCLSAWPTFEGLADREADAEIGWLIALVSEVRSVRSEMNVPGGAKLPLVLVGAGKAARARAGRYEETIKRLARIETIAFAKTPPKGAAQIVLSDMTAALPLAGIIDMDAERARLEGQIAKERAEIAKVDAKLGNADFVAKAPPEVVEENRERKAAFEATVKKLKAALKRVEVI
ncbi:MAG: valine--tRNA ligase [Hyphomicrobiaceae bacterium]|nr:valine--tRNA ligase [Hyphomicrobiaceae bacterium]